ncbi:ABC transporter substrate-binding protein [Streptomyces griseus]|uniref:Iron-siderophore uptake ABC transporter substrate-binding protein n=1 Tax=Streptomyces griseus subsp. griseus (strain JCM 4626 / CBS 651.72 / NBRC 13350 / KCC S-0626 / ISP 5235) TaxID=455632 RepID=B1VMU5_STRGG|nr:ABC transporter substrate-binding protein [Streptomyces griseus]MBW3709333.1 ABC transporter substrate-binding protein [Streptomyces griseus]BAG23570.1 putative iron-siderophore uptake ABC transporter substrate-binding protein [Streptomyces griseus subsp. griseus NBRC 13350]SEE31616.1 iron complex transport system substrate-binding protein [Streptomyces griseus]SQA25210.1 iron-siderophore uptake ABC transporter substrate-binding protein [Streptomyces griseus]
MILHHRPTRTAARRAARAVATLGAAALLLTACGTDSDSGKSSGDKAGKADSASSATRTVKDATGKAVEIPAEPKRIVTLTQEDLDAVLALDIKPVGITNGQGLDKPPAYLADKVEGIDVVGNLLQPVMDKVVAAKPDLILAGDMQDEQVLKQLREITPATLVTMAPTDDWKLFFRGVGNAVNKLDDANEFISGHEASAKAAGDKLGANKGAEVSIVRWNPDGPSWMENKQFASGVALEMGLKRPASQNKDGNAHTPSLSLEKINEIDGDWLFLSTLTSDGEKALKDVQSKPAYKELGAVKDGHAVTVDGSVWSTRGGPLAADVVLADYVKALSAE